MLGDVLLGQGIHSIQQSMILVRDGLVLPSERNRKITFNLNIQDAQVSGPDPLLEVVIFGRNNLSHQVDLLIGNDVSSMDNIGVLKFLGRVAVPLMEESSGIFCR